MKKKYLQPDMEIVELNTCQCLLAGSAETLDILDDPISDNEVLSPHLIIDVENNVLGM